MPDDRLIHLTIGHSDKINILTDFEKLVWLIYKLASDDFGVMRFSPVALQDAADWLEARPARVVERALQRVIDVGLIHAFGHQGRIYVYQFDWQTWQKITHPRKTKQPAPPLDILDRNTQWLFAHHPDGGKLKGWKAPEDFRESVPEKTGSKPELLRVATGS
jgi:hypothetical protein